MAKETPSPNTGNPAGPEAMKELEMGPEAEGKIDLSKKASAILNNLIDYSADEVNRLDQISSGYANVDTARFRLEAAKRHLVLADAAALSLKANADAEYELSFNLKKKLSDIAELDFTHMLDQSGISLSEATLSTGGFSLGGGVSTEEKYLQFGYTYTGEKISVGFTGKADLISKEAPTTTLDLTHDKLYGSLSIPLGKVMSVNDYEAVLGVKLPKGVTVAVNKTPGKLMATIGGKF